MSIVTKGKGSKYISVKCPPEFASMANKNGYVTEHRLLMAIKIGRPLTDIEAVHHIDCCGLNNNIDNLFLFKNAGDHTSFHGRGWVPGILEPWWMKSKISNHAARLKKLVSVFVHCPIMGIIKID